MRPDLEALRLDVARGSQSSSFEVAIRNARTYLMRRLTLEGPRLDLLRNDSLRGRFAGTLAVDLLAWARVRRSKGQRPRSKVQSQKVPGPGS